MKLNYKNYFLLLFKKIYINALKININYNKIYHFICIINIANQQKIMLSISREVLLVVLGLDMLK